MAGGCSYDCSRHPDKIEFDSDITGTGVIIGYVATAGIAVIMIIAHYFFAYQPNLDPFHEESNVGWSRAAPFQPNPVDLIILRCIKLPFKGFRAVKRSSPSRWSHLNIPLTKCILAMSDLQLATGTAILISGYTQLRCGLSSYHWLVIGRLAWFSSLTHLSCLTLLRNHLHNQKPQRQWRLLLMLVLIIMLITAIVPTGSYVWTSSDDLVSSYEQTASNERNPLGSDYAICRFSAPVLSGSVEALVSMVILVSLIGLGFIFRVIKLHKPLSLFMAETLRRRISQGLRRLLWMFYRWRSHPKGLGRFAGDILYYPVLALFLSLRLVADHFSSMFFEVYWLLASFLFGLWSLLRTLNVLWPDRNFHVLFDGISDNKWTFGQVMPVILLVTPLITILESLYPGKSNSTVQFAFNGTQANSTKHNISKDNPTGVGSKAPASPHRNLTNSIPLGIVKPSTTTSSNPPKLDPDQNYYHHSTAMGAGTAYILMCELALSGFFLCYTFGSTLVLAAEHLGLAFVIPPIGLWVTMLVSFPIDHFVKGKGPHWHLGILQSVNVVLISVASAGFMFLLMDATSYMRPDI